VLQPRGAAGDGLERFAKVLVALLAASAAVFLVYYAADLLLYALFNTRGVLDQGDEAGDIYCARPKSGFGGAGLLLIAEGIAILAALALRSLPRKLRAALACLLLALPLAVALHDDYYLSDAIRLAIGVAVPASLITWLPAEWQVERVLGAAALLVASGIALYVIAVSALTC
jgi:hypothetical protein